MRYAGARATGLVLVAAALLTACAGAEPADQGRAADVRVEGSAGWAGTPLTSPYPLPDQDFTDTAGRSVVPAESTTRPVTLVFFGYTNCPDVCNVVLATIASALRGSTPQVQGQVEVLFVATDPARDTPAAVREYLDRFDPAFAGLVAPAGTVEAAAADLHISYERPDGSTAVPYEVEHGDYTTGFVGGRARVVWSPETSVAELRADLERLAGMAGASA